MKQIFPHKSHHSLWLAIFVFLLLSSGSTQKCNAQFGLFDTVWTINNLPENYFISKSPNDSMFTILTAEKPSTPGEYIPRCRLFNSLSKEILWDTTNIFFGFILHDNQTILSFDSNKIILRNLLTLNPIMETTYEDPQFNECLMLWNGISEIDTSIYYAGYCDKFPLNGVSYKVNYRTGNVTITGNTLPYYALTISEDGQYVAGVYYERRNITEKDSYYEILEVRRISDYSVVFYKARFYKYFDYNFFPYNWATNYIIKISKDNKFIALNKGNKSFQVYNINTGDSVYNKTIDANLSYSTFLFSDSANILFYFKDTDYPEERKMCLLNCENSINNEISFPTGASILGGRGEALLMNNKYLLYGYTSISDSNYSNLRDLADASLLSLNFDINSIQEPPPIYRGILYPNPTTDYITVGVQNIETLQGIEIYNIFGERVLSMETGLRPVSTRIDVSGLPAGMYFVKIGNEKPMKFMVVR